MTGTSPGTRQWIAAPRAEVFRALLDADDVADWMVPDGMCCQVHRFEPREGGRFRISLTYDSPDGQGKTSAHTDTYHGYFAAVVPDRRVVRKIEFESDDVRMQGEMTVTMALADSDGGTEVLAMHEGLPQGVSTEDNDTGWRMSLAKLAALVERRVAGASTSSDGAEPPRL